MCMLARRLADAQSRASTYCSDISVDRFDKLADAYANEPCPPPGC